MNSMNDNIDGEFQEKIERPKYKGSHSCPARRHVYEPNSKHHIILINEQHQSEMKKKQFFPLFIHFITVHRRVVTSKEQSEMDDWAV